MNKYARNHPPARLYPFRGQLMTIAQIAKARGVCFSCVSRRLRAGTPLDRPAHKGRWQRYQSEPPRDWQTRVEE